jgi:hypothetical protein
MSSDYQKGEYCNVKVQLHRERFDVQVSEHLPVPIFLNDAYLSNSGLTTVKLTSLAVSCSQDKAVSRESVMSRFIWNMRGHILTPDIVSGLGASKGCRSKADCIGKEQLGPGRTWRQQYSDSLGSQQY